MPNHNPYDSLEFALPYAAHQMDPVQNWYEISVVMPAVGNTLPRGARRFVDYGCGGGFFTVLLNKALASDSEYPPPQVIGTDASGPLVDIAHYNFGDEPNLFFQEWDAAIDPAPFAPGSVDFVLGKLVFNNIRERTLRKKVLPRLRGILSDRGLLVAVMPNPYRELHFDQELVNDVRRQKLRPGGFPDLEPITMYHYTYTQFWDIAKSAGFSSITALLLPEVAPRRYKHGVINVADPATVQNAKRILYVLGATEQSNDILDAIEDSYRTWLASAYPEIADQVHLRKHGRSGMPNRALVYHSPDRSDGKVMVVQDREGDMPMTAQQKIKLARKLATAGMRPHIPAQQRILPYPFPHQKTGGLLAKVRTAASHLRRTSA